MHSSVQDMLRRYPLNTPDQQRNALKEVIQEIVLLGLSRGGFFHKGAFYGGTALRMFHGLDRFSEDLDLTLLEEDAAFNLSDFLPSVRDELGAYGFVLEAERKQKSIDTAIQSAFIKGDTLQHLLKINPVSPNITGIQPGEQVRIKLEVDTMPPAGATVDVKYQLVPIPFSVRLYDLPSLYAGKLHAILCRSWKSRVKGRDFYDFLWYVSREISPNLPHLEARMRQSGHWTEKAPLTGDTLQRLLRQRFETIDFDQAAADVRPFVRDVRALDLWSGAFFTSVLDRVKKG
jgi:predicted nucleotidyltransferase component of viral defense system